MCLDHWQLQGNNYFPHRMEVCHVTRARAWQVEREDWPCDGILARDAKERRQPKLFKEFLETLAQVNQMLKDRGEPELRESELIGIRMHTGPMYEKYNAVLRVFHAIRSW